MSGVNRGMLACLLLPHHMEIIKYRTYLLAMHLVFPAFNINGIWTKRHWSGSLKTCGQPLCCPRLMVIPSNRYSWYTHQTIHWRISSVLTISKMECPFHLALTIMPYSNWKFIIYLTKNSLAGVHNNSIVVRAQQIVVWSFSWQVMVVPLSITFIYDYSIDFAMPVHKLTFLHRVNANSNIQLVH